MLGLNVIVGMSVRLPVSVPVMGVTGIAVVVVLGVVVHACEILRDGIFRDSKALLILDCACSLGNRESKPPGCPAQSVKIDCAGSYAT